MAHLTKFSCNLAQTIDKLNSTPIRRNFCRVYKPQRIDNTLNIEHEGNSSINKGTKENLECPVSLINEAVQKSKLSKVNPLDSIKGPCQICRDSSKETEFSKEKEKIRAFKIRTQKSIMQKKLGL
ncbi:uncharacterized protein LOC109598166 [Aethina tumida]|uniref:uncharacterized protein LOC109598166 n=1 Tax=Aethina tumida TaxID=116153 RepID=UPI00096B5E48|nr:uncharacterized protein LOC109598166 [Aethina tumida]